MNEFEFDISLSVEDYADYNLTFFNKLSRITEAVLFWIFPVAFIGIAIGMFFDPKVENKGAIIVVLVFCGLSFLLSKLFVFMHRKLYPAQIRALSKRKYKNAQKDSHFRINESGIESKGELTTFFCVWKQIVKLSENENSLYVFISRNVAFIIPKRTFQSIEELVATKNLIIQQSGKEFKFIHLNKKLKKGLSHNPKIECG